MAGIYVHIPFCRQACNYCNFHFSTSLKLQNDFLVALLKEIELRRDYTAGETIDTIYFGGGTPSLLPTAHIGRILEELRLKFTVDASAEITLEANPDDINPGRLAEWVRLGINRLSIGVQSFFEADLRWMNRAHNAAQAMACIPMAQDAGIRNISIDLIYGVPGMTDDNWQTNMAKAVALGVPHLSCYALTVEPGTALDSMIRKKKVTPVNNEDQARQFLLMTDFLQKEGFDHYEISNLSRPGWKSRHNSSYWSGVSYLGLGPSAHSFNGSSRQWNIANNALYIQALNNGGPSVEMELLNDQQRFNEYLMTSVRTSEGTDLGRALLMAGPVHAPVLLKYRDEFVGKGWISASEQRMVLTREGKLFADHIASEMFMNQEQKEKQKEKQKEETGTGTERIRS